MKRKTPNVNPERKLIINLITSDIYCKSIIPLLSPKYFLTSYAREVSSWIIAYYEEFEKAPGIDIKSIYHSKRADIKDVDVQDEVSEFLTSISEEWETLEPNNIDYEIKNAELYLKIRSLDVLKENLDSAINENNPLIGEQAVSNYKRIEKSFGQGISLLKDSQKVMDAFTDADEVLFTLPGALGQVAGKFCRGDFVSFLAPMKRGKTWYLWYIAETALYMSCKVIIITLEMTEKQMIRRSWRSLLGQPKNTKTVKIPFFEKDEDSERFFISEKEEQREGIDPSKVVEYQKKFRRKFRKGDVRIISLPSKSATVQDLNSHLDNLEHFENFIPDVVVLDYADLLIPDKTVKEYRHGLDNIWSMLRSTAMARNILLVTASQTEKGTFKQDISEGSAAEDIRKIAHITCGLALNQKKEEAKMGVMRVAQVVTREDAPCFEQAIVLQCLDIGRPCIDSKLKSEVAYSLISETDDNSENKKDWKRKNRD